MKIGAIVQARMSSFRFPGKVLYEVGGKPMLQYLLESLDHCTTLEKIIVATSTEDSDNPVAAFCEKAGVPYFRGPLDNVAKRFVETLRVHPLTAFVRLNADSPILDHRLVDRAVDIFFSGRYDLVTNTLKRTFPKGQSVEVVNSIVFKVNYPLMNRQSEREHVTSYFYTHPDRFIIYNFESGKDYSDMQLSVDTSEDMRRFAAIVAKLEKPCWEYTFEDFLTLLK